jgi:hypothetical protein
MPTRGSPDKQMPRESSVSSGGSPVVAKAGQAPAVLVGAGALLGLALSIWFAEYLRGLTFLRDAQLARRDAPPSAPATDLVRWHLSFLMND